VDGRINGSVGSKTGAERLTQQPKGAELKTTRKGGKSVLGGGNAVNRATPLESIVMRAWGRFRIKRIQPYL